MTIPCSSWTSRGINYGCITESKGESTNYLDLYSSPPSSLEITVLVGWALNTND